MAAWHNVVIGELRAHGVVARHASPYALMASSTFGQLAARSHVRAVKPICRAVIREARKRVRDILVLLCLLDMRRSDDEQALDLILGRCSLWVDEAHVRTFIAVIKLSYHKVCRRLGLLSFASQCSLGGRTRPRRVFRV
jgi:hypothetical protein